MSEPEAAHEPPTPGNELLEQIYATLHTIAERVMLAERRNHTLQPTALVHEVWIRLESAARGEGWDRERFVAHAARTTRRVLVDHARRRGAERRGGNVERVTLMGSADQASDGPFDSCELLALDDALTALAARSERQARVVELRAFGGLGFREIGAELGVSDRTAKDDWRFARAWLARQLSEQK